MSIFFGYEGSGSVRVYRNKGGTMKDIGRIFHGTDKKAHFDSRGADEYRTFDEDEMVAIIGMMGEVSTSGNRLYVNTEK